MAEKAEQNGPENLSPNPSAPEGPMLTSVPGSGGDAEPGTGPILTSIPAGPEGAEVSNDPTPRRVARPRGFFGKAKQGVSEISVTLLKDSWTGRKWAGIFFLSAVAFSVLWVLLGFQIYERWQDSRKNQKKEIAGEQLNKFLEKEKEEKSLLQSRLELGRFLIELLPDPNLPANTPVTLNLAEVHITIECDSRETCKSLETQMTQIKDQLTNVLLPMDRNVLLTAQGKLDLRENIKQRLNRWLKSGKIENVYFTTLTIG